MLMLPTALKIYLAIEPVDMRKQFNGLWTLATERLREDPRQGAAFIFGTEERERGEDEAGVGHRGNAGGWRERRDQFDLARLFFRAGVAIGAPPVSVASPTNFSCASWRWR